VSGSRSGGVWGTLAVIVATAASAGFATSFGDQTNLMVTSVGGYRVADYLRAGLPLNGIVMAVALGGVWR
jgi:di/tricarboxylate transporter